MKNPPKSDQIDPLEILREEVRAAAICHGVERCDELAAKLVERYAKRLGGESIYVKRLRSTNRADITKEIIRKHNGSNTRDLAREFNYTARQIQRIVAKHYESMRRPILLTHSGDAEC